MSRSSQPTPTHLRMDGVSVFFAERRVLTDVSLTVSHMERVGLIGENGAGKSTLLRVAAGAMEPTRGEVRVYGEGSRALRVGLLEQVPSFGSCTTVSEALESAVSQVRAAAAAVDCFAQELADEQVSTETAKKYSEALEEAERLDAWTIDVRISSMLAGLGLPDLDMAARIDELSGGQRSRLALACLLLQAPDVLLLDEPTNHLDDAGIDHLRRVLLAWDGPIMMASHDRAFLDEMVTSLVDLDPAPRPRSANETLDDTESHAGAGVTLFSGTYSEYLAARFDARVRWERQYRDEQAELRRLRNAVSENQQVGHGDWRPRTEVRAAQKYYADRNAKVVSRRVNDARLRLDNLETTQLRPPPAELSFAGFTVAGTPEAGGSSPLVTVANVAVEGRLSPVSLSLAAGQKLLVTGPNGSGKSTLLSVIAGRLHPSRGDRAIRPGCRVGLLSQDVELSDVFGRGESRTARQAYGDEVGEERSVEVPLSTFGLLSEQEERRSVAALSVGQQRRLELAIVLADPPAVLLLDEPTNHFSLPLVTALETAILEYPGAVIITSHDRWLRERWTGSRLSLESRRKAS